ncbi:hypothetical protein RHSIM_RhsimUnG0011200 [Rhododendron simsii]|uniref:Uncharacterized protein n=1 Tax=Rhododendron simsii TaxID=118357 RepID=A0A834FX58_RHOSS|nr:hypothetical protein RHSIM_RhsimUnG0011200 [Rhododendron simsii]
MVSSLVQMLYQAIGDSIHLQDAGCRLLRGLYPVLVSFFSTFVVAYIVSSNNIKKLSEKEKDLRKRQREFQSDIAFFGAQITRAYSGEELNTLASIGALGEVLNGNGSLTRDARALQSTIASLLEMSSNSESNRMKSLFQVKVCAIMWIVVVDAVTIAAVTAGSILYVDRLEKVVLVKFLSISSEYANPFTL